MLVLNSYSELKFDLKVPLLLKRGSNKISQRTRRFCCASRKRNETDDNVIFIHNCIATWHSLLGQGQSKSLTAIGPREILARAARHILLGDTVTCVDGFQHDQGMPYFGGDRGWSRSMHSFYFQQSNTSDISCTKTIEQGKAPFSSKILPTNFEFRVSKMKFKEFLKVPTAVILPKYQPRDL